MKFLNYSASVLSVAALLTACQPASTSLKSGPETTNSNKQDTGKQTLPHRPDGIDLENISDADFIASMKLKSITWNTAGGGDLHYSISRAGLIAQDFTLTLTGQSFRNYNESYLISPDSGQIYKKVAALFRGKLKLTAPAETGGLSGSWSSIKLTDLSGVETEIKSPMIENRGAQKLFDELRNFIEESISSNITTCETLPSLAGIWDSQSGDLNHPIKSRSKYTEVSSANGVIEYSNVTSLDPSTPLPSPTPIQSTFSYQMDKCLIVSAPGSEVPAYKIVYISTMPGFQRIKSRLCVDINCSAFTESGTVIQTKEIP
jgi:hypothetical protein